MAERLRFALAYARLGFSVIPLAPRSKIPPKGFGVIEFRSRIATPAEIALWYSRWPDAGVAIVTGGISGSLLVLDVDPRHGGQDSLDRVGLIPECPIVKTGGGGTHFYLRGKAKCCNIAPGLDVKAEGGYVVAPPSIHPDTGQVYAWIPEMSPSKVQRSDCPPWLVAMLAPVCANAEAPKRAWTAHTDALSWLGLVFEAIATHLEATGHRLHPVGDGGFETTCPLHADRKPSLSIHPEKGWQCFAGCGSGRLTELAARLHIAV